MYGFRVGTLIHSYTHSHLLPFMLRHGLIKLPKIGLKFICSLRNFELEIILLQYHQQCGYRSVFPAFWHRSDLSEHELKYVIWGDFHKQRAPNRHLDWDDTHLSTATNSGYHAHFYLVTERPPAENQYKIINRTLSTLRDQSFDVFYVFINIYSNPSLALTSAFP